VHYVTVEVDDEPANDHIQIFSAGHLKRLRQLADDLNVGMIVLDPALDVLDRIDVNQQQDAREAIGRINNFAEEQDILILGLAHFNKMTSVDTAIDRITGSAAFSQRIRAVLTFAFNDETRTYVIGQPKNNWGRTDLPILQFDVRQVEIGQGFPMIKLQWMDDSEYSPDDILARRHKRGEPSKAELARQFLSSYLSNGAAPRAELLDKGAELGHGAKTLERAANDLGVISNKIKRGRGSRGNPGVTWELPE
jgi:hypothetical protein